jgi:hypothetical protein
MLQPEKKGYASGQISEGSGVTMSLLQMFASLNIEFHQEHRYILTN